MFKGVNEYINLSVILWQDSRKKLWNDTQFFLILLVQYHENCMVVPSTDHHLGKSLYQFKQNALHVCIALQ